MSRFPTAVEKSDIYDNSKKCIMKEKTKNNITTALTIVGTVALLGTAIIMPNILVAADALFDISGRRKFKRNFYDLRRRKYIEIFEENNIQKIRITDKGRERLLKLSVADLIISIPKRWDKKWRLVTFDIPEEYRQGRDALRDVLRKLGFYKLQQSVFIYPYECEREIKKICSFFDLAGKVFYMQTELFDGDEKIKRHFKLE